MIWFLFYIFFFVWLLIYFLYILMSVHYVLFPVIHSRDCNKRLLSSKIIFTSVLNIMVILDVFFKEVMYFWEHQTQTSSTNLFEQQFSNILHFEYEGPRNCFASPTFSRINNLFLAKFVHFRGHPYPKMSFHFFTFVPVYLYTWHFLTIQFNLTTIAVVLWWEFSLSNLFLSSREIYLSWSIAT